MRLTFIRHGQSTANAEGWIAGHVDAPLTELGRAQAIALREQLDTVRFDRALCSDLRRAHETAELVLAGRGPVPERLTALRERDAGVWEHRRVEVLEQAGDMAWLRTFDGRPPGGESLRDVALRVIGALLELDLYGEVLVVGHGAMMRATIGVLDGVPFEGIGTWQPGNCELVVREADLAAALAMLR